ncbi:MAG: NAD(+)/NADH kinase [Eggerthellaceae bacterium]|nr:NAD(+)/NADH kinase [Eggerthellaceae bacterium]
MRVCIVKNNSNSKAVEASLLLCSYFEKMGIAYECVDLRDDPYPFECDFDMVISLGGDGTIIRCARFIGYAGVPLLSANFGHLGFMANNAPDGIIDLVSKALADEASVEMHTNLRIDVICEGEDEDALLSGNGEVSKDLSPASRSFFALNEIVVSRGNSARILEGDVKISGKDLFTIRGDGIIVSSATGSSGYALSAGGPLISPDFEGLAVVQLAPHSLNARSVLTGQNDIIEIDVAEMASTRYPATIDIDGDRIPFEKPISKILVRRGDEPTKMLRFEEGLFFKRAAQTFFK